MRISNDVFIPSVVKNDIYDILNEHIVIAGNEYVYDKEIVTDIIKLLDEHPKERQFTYSTRDEDNSTEMLIVSWLEIPMLLHEVFLYDNGNRMYNED